MRLENLYPNFGKVCAEEQAAYIASYRLRRAQDLASEVKEKKSRAVKKSKIDLSEEEKVMMKLLGLKQKDIVALRALEPDQEQETTDDTSLLNESTFAEGEEDE
ncbi:MAG: hypothetical protein WC554_09555 [Clostridia bacterium]